MSKRKVSSESNSSFEIIKFKPQASSFGIYEEAALNIIIDETDNIGCLFNEIVVDLPPHLSQFELDDFGYDDILIFKPHVHTELNKNQRIFLNKLKYVLINNQYAATGRVEAYVQDLIDNFLKECEMEDGLTLHMLPSRLYLSIGDDKFAAFSDKEGRKLDDIIWILEESKHKYDTRYKQGDIQLIASLIAACQLNFIHSKKIYPEHLYGIKVVGEEFYFYKVVFSENYINELTRDLPQTELKVLKYPKLKGLRISNNADRKEILILINSLNKYALNLDM